MLKSVLSVHSDKRTGRRIASDCDRREAIGKVANHHSTSAIGPLGSEAELSLESERPKGDHGAGTSRSVRRD